MRRLIAAIVLAIGVLALGGNLPAAAHPVRPVERSTVERSTDETPIAPGGVVADEARQFSARTASPTEAPSPPLAVAGALLALAAMLVALGSRRRVVGLGLALVMLALSFEGAVHSVHHLGSSEESKCAVAVAATHVQGAVGEPVIALAELVSVGAVPTVAEPVRLAAKAWRAWRGRAPPSASLS